MDFVDFWAPLLDDKMGRLIAIPIRRGQPMPLTLQKVPTRPTIVAPVHRMHPDADPDWRRVEAVASRFKIPSHRTAVRMYLYSVLRDVVALRTFGDRLLYPGKLRKAIRKGKGLLDEARRIEPELMDALMAELEGLDVDRTKARIDIEVSRRYDLD